MFILLWKTGVKHAALTVFQYSNAKETKNIITEEVSTVIRIDAFVVSMLGFTKAL